MPTRSAVNKRSLRNRVKKEHNRLTSAVSPRLACAVCMREPHGRCRSDVSLVLERLLYANSPLTMILVSGLAQMG